IPTGFSFVVVIACFYRHVIPTGFSFVVVIACFYRYFIPAGPAGLFGYVIDRIRMLELTDVVPAGSAGQRF
ncbi:MAG: hypothetical protein LBS55_13605, partial [Prevotellaceae bacterium]|nr:hypothetical protein [Prevotellaceae bacterium]